MRSMVEGPHALPEQPLHHSLRERSPSPRSFASQEGLNPGIPFIAGDILPEAALAAVEAVEA
jgi:hypothetical protein